MQLKSPSRNVVRQYAGIQIADLYARFSPVELIHHPDNLNSDSFVGGLGRASIWERIKKVGETKFYRVEYHSDMTDEEKRMKAKDDITGYETINL